MNLNIVIVGGGQVGFNIAKSLSKEDHAITVIDINPQKCLRIQNSIDAKVIEGEVIMEDFDSKFDMIVNASSLGLKGEKNIIPRRLFDEQTTVYDIVYKPIKTDLINTAKKRKSRIIFGYEMLLGQAIRSFEIWLDKQAPYDAMKRAILGGF